MKIRFVYGLLPVFIFYHRFIKVGGAFLMFISINTKYKDNKALEAHELIHVKQAYITLLLHPVLYHFSRRYRLKSELEAYEAQISINNLDTLSKAMWITRTLYQDYKLDMPFKYIQDEVKKRVGKIHGRQ